MRLVFIDETSDKKFKDFLGFSLCSVDSRFYPSLKEKAQQILFEIEWDPAKEFKGSYLFSASSGCTGVQVEARVEAARKLLELNVGAKNSRMQFAFGKMSSTNHGKDYIEYLPGLLHEFLPKAPKGAGKNLIAVVVDQRSDISAGQLHDALAPAAEDRGYVVLERIIPAVSNFDTVGLMFADLVGYLSGRIHTIANDAELIEGLSPEQLESNGKLKKLKSSQSLIGTIKKLDVFTPK